MNSQRADLNSLYAKVTKSSNRSNPTLFLRHGGESLIYLFLSLPWPRYITLSGCSMATRHLIKDCRAEEWKIKTVETKEIWGKLKTKGSHKAEMEEKKLYHI